MSTTSNDFCLYACRLFIFQIYFIVFFVFVFVVCFLIPHLPFSVFFSLFSYNFLFLSILLSSLSTNSHPSFDLYFSFCLLLSLAILHFTEFLFPPLQAFSSPTNLFQYFHVFFLYRSFVFFVFLVWYFSDIVRRYILKRSELQEFWCKLNSLEFSQIILNQEKRKSHRRHKMIYLIFRAIWRTLFYQQHLLASYTRGEPKITGIVFCVTTP